MNTIEIRTVSDKTLKIEINNVRKSFRYNKYNFHHVMYKIFKYLDKNNLGNLFYAIRRKTHDRLTTDVYNNTYGKTYTYFTM